MAEWQYKSNAVPVNRGYAMTLPNRKADEQNYTAYLQDQDGAQMYLWLHNIEAGFEMGGNFAQSARKRDWYPRNFSQASFALTGRTANQAEYHKLAEFIRKTQDKSLRWKDTDPIGSTVLLGIPSSGRHAGHSLRGHILHMERTSERWIFAPEYRFEFLISAAHVGLFETKTANSEVAKRKLAPWMDIFLTKKARFQKDPDNPVTPPPERQLPETVSEHRSGN